MQEAAGKRLLPARYPGKSGTFDLTNHHAFMEFAYDITEKQGYHLVRLKGNLIEKNQANSLMDEIEGLSEKENSRFVISLDEFKYMNSTGLNVLLGILSKARRSGGEAVVCAVPEKTHNLLVITKLVNVFQVVENEDQAVKAFQAN